MTEPSATLPGISPEDLALFQSASAAIDEAYMARVTADCPQELVPGGVSFPIGEPSYNAKRPRDLRPFTDAIALLPAERRSELDALLADKTIPAMQVLMNDGTLNAVELVTYYVERIQRFDLDCLNSVLELNPHALAIAAERDAERAAGKVRGPLHGIPLLLKDNIATGDGMHTTAGAYALKDWQPSRDAFQVQKLRAAGAVILGKTNLSEWANFMDGCMPNGFSVLGGQTRSPYGPFDPAGSSSGSAVAAAANFAAAAIGSETSGSLIQPARFNSLVSLRPSLGLISRDYVVPLAPDLDTTGPMTRSVTDTAVLLNVLAGVDPQDAKTQDAAALEGVDFTQCLSLEAARKLRVGVIIPSQASAALLQNKKQLLEKAKDRQLSEEEQAALLAQEVLPELGGDPSIALAALKALGIAVVEIDDATLPPGPDTAGPLLFCNFRQSVVDFFTALPQPSPIQSLADVVAINNQDPANRAPYGQGLLARAAQEPMTGEEYARIQAVAAALAHQWMDSVLETNGVDLLVSGMAYTGSAGAAGVPALTLPAGLDPSGRPQGIILTGDYLSDPQLLSLGYALEQQIGGRVEPNLHAVIEVIDALRMQ